MFNAGCACAEVIIKESGTPRRAVCVCGKGKNGGDGFVIAENLLIAGYNTKVILTDGAPTAEDPLYSFNRIDPTKVIDYKTDKESAVSEIEKADIIIDAIFGFGFKGSLPDNITEIADVVNKSNASVYAVDIPSGVECDTGKINGACIKADRTLAISYRKPCHLLFPGAEACGKTSTVKIGIKKKHSATVADAGFFSLPADGSGIKLPDRSPLANKGDFGRILSICGSKKYPGAACFAAEGAVRTGAGLVFAAFPDSAYPAIASKLREPVMLPLPSTSDGFVSRGACSLLKEEIEKATVITIGCGLGQGLGQAELLDYVIENSACPMIIDADGINLLKRAPQLMEKLKSRAILTPHPGEMARLVGASISLVQEKRIELAKAFAERLKITLVLKGANTVVASPGNVYVNSTGNPGMAKGGSGDVLAGMIAGLAAQGLENFYAAVAGVYLHGLAGDMAAKEYSVHGMTPTNMLDILPKILVTK